MVKDTPPPITAARAEMLLEELQMLTNKSNKGDPMTKDTPLSLTAAECDLLLDQLCGPTNPGLSAYKGNRNYLIALLMLDAGLRIGEVLQLVPSDLVFDYKPVTSITVRKETTKTKLERVIPMTTRLSGAIGDMIEAWLLLPGHTPSVSCFQSSVAGPRISARQVERIIRNAGYHGIGRPIHPHQLRHTFATRLLKITNIRTVQQLLGHKNLSSTEIYTHPGHQDKVDAIAEMEQNF